ncbi:hypothetical protein [Halomonas sp. 707B3]|uniref:beta strand repeat-containing protein n=1 Tax=Halomonas sp. 707B3 TaxID=1681043 RepID=UPI00209D995B|nr:hypothetical protein [Halomonas sp. 707B3]MCP1318600.1 hypothetical protein [Halomonas sp. 707B3]
MIATTANNDTINGAAGTLQSGDVIVDSSTTDNDVANLVVSGAIQTPTIANIETLNLDFALGSNGINVSKVTSTSKLNIDSTAAGQTSATVNGLKSGHSLAIDDTITSLTVATNSATANDEAVSIALNGSDATLNTSAANDIDQLTLNSTGSANKVTLGTAADTFSATNEKIIATGDQNLTISTAYTANANGLDAATVENNLTGDASLTVELTGALAAAEHDFSKVAADAIQLKTAAVTGANVKVASGQNVALTGDYAGNGATVTSATATTGVINLSATANQTGVLTLNDFATVNLDVAANREFAGVTLGTASGLGTSEVVASGAGNLTLGSVTAKVVNASEVSGTVNLSAGRAMTITTGTGNDVVDTADNAVTVNTGAGNDRIVLGTAKDTVNAGAGNDTIQFAADGELTGGTTIDGGAGTDTLQYTGGAGALNLSDNTFTLTGVEAINLSAVGANAATFTGAQLNDANLNIVGNGGTLVVNPANGTTAESINLSGINHSGFTSATLNGSTQADILVGSQAADVIVGGTGVVVKNSQSCSLVKI